jgi:PAS domain S-box-containing protein
MQASAECPQPATELALLFDLLANGIDTGVFVETATGQVVFVSDHLKTSLGLAEPLSPVSRLEDWVAPEAAQRLQTRRARSAQGKGHRFVLRSRSTESEVSDLTLRFLPIFDSVGTYAGGIGLVDSGQATPGPEILTSVLEHSRDCLYMLRLETNKFVYVSPAIERIAGLRPEDLIRQGWQTYFERIHADDQAAYLDFGRRIVRGTELTGAEPGLTYRFLHADGRTLYLTENAVVFAAPDGEGRVRVGTVRNVTRARLAESAILGASRMRGTAALASSAGQRFNNLMATVLGNAELLQKRATLEPDAERYLERVLDATRQASHLAGRLLSYARGGVPTRQLLNLNEVVESVLSLEGHAVPKRIGVVRQLAPQLHHLYGDPAQLEQVIINLCLNAIEAMPDGGAITVRTDNVVLESTRVLHSGTMVPGEYIRLTIEDTGVGISRDVAARIFEPFFSTRAYGRGLGLSSVLQIVREHNGSLEFTSRTGKGSVFEIYLPTPVAQLEPGYRAPGRAHNVLVCGQDYTLIKTLTRMLVRLRCNASHVQTPGEVRQTVSKQHPDLCLFVLPPHLPAASERANVATFRQDAGEIPILVIGGAPGPETPDRAVESGADAYLPIPFRFGELEAAVIPFLSAQDEEDSS